jgi:hypothetical protein
MHCSSSRSVAVPSFAERAEQRVARCTTDDLDELWAFQDARYGDRVDRIAVRRVDWLYRENPFHDPAGLGIWITRGDDRIVGQQAEIGVGLHACGEDLRAAAAIALMVDPAWRLRGVGPALSNVARRGSRVSYALSISDDAAPMYQRSGWLDLGEIHRYAFFAGASALPGAGGRRRLLRPLLSAAAVAAAATARLRTVTSRFVGIDAFDERADEVWENASSSYAVLARRDARWLGWRFDASPSAGAYRRFYLMRSGRAVGYVVLRPTRRNAAPALQILDYLARPQDVGTLFAHCVALARRERVAELDLVTRNPAAHRRILSLGFVSLTRMSRRVPLRFMVSVSPEDPIASCVAVPDNWFVTRADSDLEFESGALSVDWP